MSASTLVPFALHGTGEGVKQNIAVDGGPLSFGAEGHRAFGGTDSEPSPLDFALGALTSCTQVTGQIVASGDRSIELGRWKIAVKANLDGAVLLNGGPGVSNFRDVDLSISVETNLDESGFSKFVAESFFVHDTFLVSDSHKVFVPESFGFSKSVAKPFFV